MKKHILICLLLISNIIYGQNISARRATIGFEVDALPYLTEGYYGSVWIGCNQMRYRAIVTKVYPVILSQRWIHK